MLRTMMAAVGATAFGATIAVAQTDGENGDASAPPVVRAAYDCISAYVPKVDKAEDDLSTAVNFLTGYVCQEEVARASLYRQNAYLVDTFAERLQQRLEKSIAVDAETGELITDLTVEQAAGLGYQDWGALQNELSAQSQGPLRYFGNDPVFTTFAARALLELRVSGGDGDGDAAAAGPAQ